MASTPDRKILPSPGKEIKPMATESPQSTQTYTPDIQYGGAYDGDVIKPIKSTPPSKADTIPFANTRKNQGKKKWYLMMQYQGNFGATATMGSVGDTTITASHINPAGEALDFADARETTKYCGELDAVCPEDFSVHATGTQSSSKLKTNQLALGVGYVLNKTWRSDITFSPQKIYVKNSGIKSSASQTSDYTYQTAMLCADNRHPYDPVTETCPIIPPDPNTPGAPSFPKESTPIGNYNVEQRDTYNVSYQSPTAGITYSNTLDWQWYANKKLTQRTELFASVGVQYQRADIRIGDGTITYTDTFTGRVDGNDNSSSIGQDNSDRWQTYKGKLTQTYSLETETNKVKRLIKPSIGIGISYALSEQMSVDVGYRAYLNPKINLNVSINPENLVLQDDPTGHGGFEYEPIDSSKNDEGTGTPPAFQGWSTRGVDGAVLTMSNGQELNVIIPRYIGQSITISLRFYLQ